MGCECMKPTSADSEIEKNNAGQGFLTLDQSQQDKAPSENRHDFDGDEQNPGQNLELNDYQIEALEIINQIRTDPGSFSENVENSIQYITEIPDKENPTTKKLIFKKIVKVALNRGAPAFTEAAEQLREINPMEPLVFKQEICVPIPETEKELKDTNYLKHQIKKIKQHDNVDVFYKDLIKLPDVSVLLMAVDDSGKNAGKKRMALLNEDFKYIGISSGTVGKSFVAYFTFSK